MVNLKPVWNRGVSLLPHGNVCPPPAVTYGDFPVSAVTLVQPDPAGGQVFAIFHAIIPRCQNPKDAVVSTDKAVAYRLTTAALTQLRRLFHVGLLHRLTLGGAVTRRAPDLIGAVG